MAAVTPFSQLTGVLKVYLAPYGESVPDVDTTPGGNWAELGSTDGEQSMKFSGKATWFRDNDHQGPVKGIRPEEDIAIKFRIVDLTLENWAKVVSTINNIVTGTTGLGANTKKFPFKRGAQLIDYALIFKGETISPYGAYPGQFVLPRMAFSSEPELKFGRNLRAFLDVDGMALEDDNQSEADRLGWLIVKTS